MNLKEYVSLHQADGWGEEQSSSPFCRLPLSLPLTLPAQQKACLRRSPNAYSTVSKRSGWVVPLASSKRSSPSCSILTFPAFNILTSFILLTSFNAQHPLHPHYTHHPLPNHHKTLSPSYFKEKIEAISHKLCTPKINSSASPSFVPQRNRCHISYLRLTPLFLDLITS